MYVPKRYGQDDVAIAHDLIRNNVFAAVVTEVAGRLDVTHIPTVLDAGRGELGAVRFHLAAINPAADALREAKEILMVFTGPHTYISPDWYVNDDLVPTWNYAVVHAYGVPRVLDESELRAQLDDLSAAQEGRLPKKPWTTDKMRPETLDKMCRVIVGFDMPITELQGKWKMSQNRTADDCEGIVAALDELGGDANAAVAETMRSLATR